MKNKKGFTLIELLAVIVILAIIALIAVPVILNILDKSNKSAFKDTAYGIISAGELYFAEQQLELKGMLEDKEFTLPNDNIDIKGEVPEGTKLYINTQGQIALVTTNGRYCITKGYEDKDITVSEDLENCTLPDEDDNTGGTIEPDEEENTGGTGEKTLSQLIQGTNECTTDKTAGACALGTTFTIKVNDEKSYNFYVIADDGEKLTLIMSENLGNTVSWFETAQNSSQGPTTAINYLDELTDDEWTNIPKQEYTYSGIAEDGVTRIYRDFKRTMRVRMLTYGEANAIKTANNGTLPPYMYGGTGYWTSTASSSSNYAWYVSASGGVYHSNSIFVDLNYRRPYGVRPVIELYK